MKVFILWKDLSCFFRGMSICPSGSVPGIEVSAAIGSSRPDSGSIEVEMTAWKPKTFSFLLGLCLARLYPSFASRSQGILGHFTKTGLSFRLRSILDILFFKGRIIRPALFSCSSRPKTLAVWSFSSRRSWLKGTILKAIV